jgi:guanylate cyclase
MTVRIGMATGPAVAGVIGTRKFAYDLWGTS